MIRRILAVLRAPFPLLREDDANEDADENGEDDGEGSRFVPSRLDASVLYAHGMGNAGVERELANVEEKAQILEAHREK